MKTAFPELVGNSMLKERFRDEILGGTLAHAYILEGQDGSGKHLFSRLFAAALSCENKENDDFPLPCGVCPTCKKILSGNSPDLIYIGRKDKATIGVDPIRELRLDTAVAPNDLDVKLYVIEEAQLMTIQAQNALLLTLEEPPEYVRFLLLCESASPLLETIKSRAPLLRMEPLSGGLISEELKKRSPEAASLAKNDPAAFSELVAASDGSLGRALSYLDAGTQKALIAKRTLAKDFIRLAGSEKRAAETVDLLSRFPQKREELTETCSMILTALRDLAAIKRVDEPTLYFFSELSLAEELAYPLSLPKILGLEQSVAALSESINRNANIRLALTAFASDAGLL
ncbi:MAG: hypothetical protein IJR88_02730 [Clostridia bacterium]|nr:hypothetical protein [Clostridia bacterium]